MLKLEWPSCKTVISFLFPFQFKRQQIRRFFPLNRYAANRAANSANHAVNSANHAVNSAHHAVNSANHAVIAAHHAVNLAEQNVYKRGYHLKTQHVRSPMSALPRAQKQRPLRPRTGQKQYSLQAIVNRSVSKLSKTMDARNRIQLTNYKTNTGTASYKRNTQNTRRIPRRNYTIHVNLNQVQEATEKSRQRTTSIKASNVRNLQVTHARSGTDISINKRRGKTSIHITRTYNDKPYTHKKIRGNNSRTGASKHVAPKSLSTSIDTLSGHTGTFQNHVTGVRNRVYKTNSDTKINSQLSVYPKPGVIPSLQQHAPFDATAFPAESWNMTIVMHTTKATSAYQNSSIAASKLGRSIPKLVNEIKTYQGAPHGFGEPGVGKGTVTVIPGNVGTVPHRNPIVYVANISTLDSTVSRTPIIHKPSVVPKASVFGSVFSRQPISDKLAVVTVPNLSAVTPVPSNTVVAEDIEVQDVPDKSDITNVYTVLD